jgi:hypothetical protein
MKRDVMIDGSLSALNADIGENKCGIETVKLVFLITNTPMTLNVGDYFFCQKVSF